MILTLVMELDNIKHFGKLSVNPVNVNFFYLKSFNSNLEAIHCCNSCLRTGGVIKAYEPKTFALICCSINKYLPINLSRQNVICLFFNFPQIFVIIRAGKGISLYNFRIQSMTEYRICYKWVVDLLVTFTVYNT